MSHKQYCIHQEGKKIHPVNTSPASSKILLSGASGMLGTAVRLALGGRNAQLLQLVRRDPVAAGQLQWNPAASPAITDPEPLEGLTAAIHLSGASVAAHRWTPAYKREIRTSRVDSTKVLAVTLAALRQPPKTLLVASATGIYGDRGDEMLDESSGPGSGFLANLCREWEAAAQPASDAVLRVVHLRFGVVIGPSAGALAKMLPLFRLGLGGRLGSGRQWMSWISLADAVSAVLFALDTPTLTGPVNLTAPQPVTNAEFTRALARAVHRPALMPAPAFALRLALGQMADEALLASARVVPARLTSADFRFTHPTLDAALAAALAPAR
ncbi:MAG TPA: TIGR01777 family oxidoreductase [Terracidiphilus sp.]|nr:TIGR01777 family oxidoreductase [Terracidiphilus sp.]